MDGFVFQIRNDAISMDILRNPIGKDRNWRSPRDKSFQSELSTKRETEPKTVTNKSAEATIATI